VTLRPKWSKISDGTIAWRSYVRLFLAAALVGSCSALDPNVGTRRDPLDDIPDAGQTDTGSDDVGDPGDRFFATHIRPLMNRPGKGDPSGRGCKGCHYSTELQHTGLDLGGLDLATLGSLRHGGGSSGRRIVVPGKPSESVLVQVLEGTYPKAARMPKNGNPFWDQKEEIDVVRAWIANGAKGADDE